MDDETADSVEDALARVEMRKEDIFPEFTSITLFQDKGRYDFHVQGATKGAVSTTVDANGKASNLRVLIEQARDQSLPQPSAKATAGLLEFEWNARHSDVKLNFGKHRKKFLAKDVATSFEGMMYVKWLYNNHLRITQEVKDFIEKLWKKRQPLYIKKRDLEAESYRGLEDDPRGLEDEVEGDVDELEFPRRFDAFIVGHDGDYGDF